MKLERFDKINKGIIINTKSFSNIKIKVPCKVKIFEKYHDDSFIIVLDNGKVIIYDKLYKNTFNNLREVISLYGSKFFKYPISNDSMGIKLVKYYEEKTGLKIREIYKYNLD